MTFQNGGHGCLGVGGILGAFGIHGPEDHGPVHGGKPGGGFSLGHHFGLGGGGGGGGGLHVHKSEGIPLYGDHPLGLIFGDPEAAANHHYSLAAIPIGGGWTVSIIAVLMALCILAVALSAIYCTVAIRYAHAGAHRRIEALALA